MTDRDVLLDITGVARRLGCSPSSVRRFEAAGVLPKGIRLEPSNRRVWWLSQIQDAARRNVAPHKETDK